MLFTRLAALTVLALMGYRSARAQATFTSIASGDWNGGLTVWSVSGTDADNIPDADDDVVIASGHTINVNVNAACNNITLNGTANLNFNTNNRTLDVNGLMTMNGNSQVSGNNNSRILNLNGNFSIPAGQTGSIGGVRVVQSAPQTFTVSGTFIPSSATGIKNLGDVIINSTGSWTAVSNESYTVNNLTLYNGSVINGSVNATLIANGNLTVFPSSPGLHAKLGRINLTVNGTTTVMANGYLEFSESNAGTKRFNGTITVNLGGIWDNIVGEDPVVNCSIINNGVWPVPTGGNGRYDVTDGGNYTYSGNAEIGMTRLRLRNGSVVTNTGTLRLTKTGGQALSVESGSTFINGNGTSGYLILTGDGNVVDVTGALSSVNFSPANNIVEYSGTVNQTIYPTIYHHIRALNGFTKTINGTTTVNGNFTINSNTLVDVAGGNDLVGPGNLIMTETSRIRISSAGTVPALTGTAHSLAPGTTIELNRGGAQVAASSTIYPYQNLHISGAGGSAVNMSAVSNIAQDFIITNQGTFNSNALLTVGGTFNYTSSGTSVLANNITVGNFVFQNGGLNYSSRTITINGNDGTWTFNGGGGVFTTDATSRVIFTAGTNQKISGTAVTTFANLEIDNPNGVTLDGIDANVSTGLTFTNGNIITGSNVLICTNASVTVTPTNGFVEGYLRKPVVTGAPALTFEVGTGTVYSPLNLTFTGVTTAGNFTVAAFSGDHPDILGSNIEPNRSVNRHWSVTNNAVTFGSVNAVFNFNSSDLDPLADFTNFSVRRFDGINWNNTTAGIRTATSTQITGETSAGLPNNQERFYQIGELIPTSGTANRLPGTQNWSNPATWIQNRTGAIQFTAGSTAVTGVGTLFTTELVPGDVLMLQTTPGTVRGTVQTIIDNENLTLVAPATASANGGYGRQYVPNTVNDQVIIGNSNIVPDAATTIILDMNATVNSLDISTVASPRSTAQVLTHAGTNSLTVQTNVRVNHPPVATSVTNSWNINAGSATVGGNVVIGSGVNNANGIARVNITTGTLNVGTTLLFFTSNQNSRELTAILDMTGGNGTVNLSGSLGFSNGRGLLLPGTSGSVFNYNRTSSGQTVNFPSLNQAANPFTYHNLHLNNTSASGVILATNISAANVTGDVRVQSGTLRLHVGRTITGNPTRTFEVAPGAIFRLQGTQPFPAGFGTFDLGTTAPFGTVVYETTNNQTIANHNYGHLVLRANRTYSIPNTTVNVAGNLTLGDGTSTVTLQDQGGGGASAISVSGDLTINANARLNAAANNGISAITVGGNWVNNSSTGGSNGFDEGTSTVIFNSPASNTLQTIGGTIAETFYDLTLNTSAASDVVRILNNTNVSNQLTLTQGELDLNGLTLYLTNPVPGAITRTNGYIKSENNTSPYGTLQRQTGTATGAFVFPFGKSPTEYIPFTFNITSAGSPAAGSVSVSTYPTGTDNTPYPVGVTNLNGTSGGLAVVDRFWVITLNNYTGTRPTSTLTFTATPAEIASTGATTINAQRWAPSNTWEPALPGQTYNSGAGTVTVPNVSQYSPWALADVSAPLPVELTSFNLVVRNGYVEVGWTTASELNNDYFTVERRQDGAEEFEALATLPGAGTTQKQNRYRFEDYSVSPGIWYYRIKQTDFDGTYSYSQVKSVEVSGQGMWQIFPNPSDGQLMNVRFTAADLNKQARISVLDAQGRLVHSEQVTISGLTVPVQFNQKLQAGIYLVVIRTPDDAVQYRWVVR
ncbi:MAG: hypothetical protein KatS3mg032_1968 [Cyclobacteriaceae bacterium]|nr:MAG: hypothetical protein KatS3mg032_1968 [Cyclobacteriaceae bacterium]